MAFDYVGERRALVNRHYRQGDYLIALTEMNIEVDDGLLHIPVGHKLTRSQALWYPGDVRVVRCGVGVAHVFA